ncbi:unnamed protein product [Coregonus sp. 'balchen']|nr:unnamed protein product [Coregonus sp. 'balchen']
MRRRRSACSVNSDSSDIDIDLLAETELSKLQRQFRIMEGDRQVYNVESQDLIRRQLREIQRLHGEREELLRSLRVSESPFRRWDDADATQNLSSMLVYRDRVEEQLDSEQGKMTYLRQENGQLREELKILHVERKQFLPLYCRMERELQEIRKDIRDMMAQSTAAFKARRLGLDTQGGAFGTLDSLQETFHKIHCVTGEEDLHKLVGTFIQIEEQNFALLNFVNEQNNEAETLKDEINQHEEHRAMLQGVNVQQQATEQQVGAYQQLITSVGKILNQLKTGIDSVCHNIDCDLSVIEDKLGSSTGIRDSTIMTYLGLVERRTNELLTLQSFLSSKVISMSHHKNAFIPPSLLLWSKTDPK